MGHQCSCAGCALHSSTVYHYKVIINFYVYYYNFPGNSNTYFKQEMVLKKNFHKGTAYFRHRSGRATLMLEDKKQIKKAKPLI